MKKKLETTMEEPLIRERDNWRDGWPRHDFALGEVRFVYPKIFIFITILFLIALAAADFLDPTGV